MDSSLWAPLRRAAGLIGRCDFAGGGSAAKDRRRVVYPRACRFGGDHKSAAGQMTFLTTEFGKPFTAAGFGNWFREQCDMANLRHCSAHGLRKAAARQLAEAGCTEHEIAAITGHASLREI